MATKKSASHLSTPRLSTLSRAVLPGSEKAPFVTPVSEKPASLTKRFTVSVLVKRKQPLKVANRLGKARLTHAQYRQTHGADPAAVKLVRAFAKEFDLKVEPDTPGPERRIIKLSGTVDAMQKAFGVTLTHKTHEGTTYRMREGAISLPKELIGSVEAVLGLDNRPQAEPHFRIAGEQGNLTARIAQGAGFASAHAASSGASFTPVQIAQLYQFPANATAAGQTIGIIELGGGFRAKDITAYFKSLGQKTPTVTAVSVDGGKNSPSNANSADGEVMLDIEVAAAVAPGANIVVYFAPNTDQGFVDAIGAAVHDTTNKPSVISISWGAAEVNWTQQAMSALDAACQSAAALGISITVAAGDNGSTDGGTGDNVDFPASSPHVLACGGTKLTGSGTTITDEVVWNELSQQRRRNRRRRQQCLPSAHLAVQRQRSQTDQQRRRPRRPRRRRRRRPLQRLRHPRRWQDHGHRRHQRRSSALGRPHRGRQPAERQDRRTPPAADLRRQSQVRLPRHHLRQQRQLQRRAGLGCLHRPRLAHHNISHPLFGGRFRSC